MSSPIGQEAVCGVYPNSDRFKVKFSSLGDCYYERTVNIATFWPECYSWTSTIDTLKIDAIPFITGLCEGSKTALAYCPFTSNCVLLRLIFVSLEFLWDDFL